MAKSIEEIKVEITNNFIADVESLSKNVSTLRINLGRVLNRLDKEILRIEDKKVRRAFRKSQWEFLQSAHGLEKNELTKALRLFKEGFSIKDLEGLQLRYNHLFEMAILSDLTKQQRLYGMHYLNVCRMQNKRPTLEEIKSDIIPAMTQNPEMGFGFSPGAIKGDTVERHIVNAENWGLFLKAVGDAFFMDTKEDGTLELIESDMSSYVFADMRNAIDAIKISREKIEKEKEADLLKDDEDFKEEDQNIQQKKEDNTEPPKLTRAQMAEKIEKLLAIIHMSARIDGIDMSRLVGEVSKEDFIKGMKSADNTALDTFINATLSGKDIKDDADRPNIPEVTVEEAN